MLDSIKKQQAPMTWIALCFIITQPQFPEALFRDLRQVF